MAVREIILFSNDSQALRKVSEPVREITADIKMLIRDLKDTLQFHTDGIGLAAPQINVHSRVVIVRLGGYDEQSGADPPIALVNPAIVEARDHRKDFDGCLSFPGLYGETIRPHYLRVTGWDEDGRTFDRVYQDFDAVVVHHEIDHLDGILFIDHITHLNDLYRVALTEKGELVRIPFHISQEYIAEDWM